MLSPDNQHKFNTGGPSPEPLDDDYSQRKISSGYSPINDKEEIFEVGFGISDCVKYFTENPASGTFMLVIDAMPERLLNINSEIVTAIPKTPGGFHSNAVEELNFYLEKKKLKYDYSETGKSHIINGTVGPGRIDLRIDGGNESEYFYKSIEILSKISKKLDLKLYVFETTGENKLESWGLAHLKASIPKRTRELKKSVNNRKVSFYTKEDDQKVFLGYNYYAFAAGTRYISLEVLNKIDSFLANSDSDKKRLGLNALVKLSRGINLNFRGTAFDIDFLLVDRNHKPLNFKDSKLEHLREELKELAQEALRFIKLWPNDDQSAEAIETLDEFCHIYQIKFDNFVKDYKKNLPEVLRNNATDTYDWNSTMYSVLYGVNQDPWKNLGQVEINVSYSLSLPENTKQHLYSKDVGACSVDSPPQIVNSSMPDDNVISLSQGKYTYRKRSLKSHSSDLIFEMMQALDDEKINLLNSDNLLPEALYFGKIYKLGEYHNTQAARILSTDMESERYVLILSYPEGEEKIMLFTSINNFLEYAKISQERYWKSYFPKDKDSLIDYSIDYSDLQNSYYEYLYSLLSNRAEVRVNKAKNVLLPSCDETHFTLTEYVKGYSPKDKKPIEDLSPEDFEKYLSQLAVAVVSHIITQKTRGIEDDCVYDGKNLTITNTNTALDPEGFFDDEKNLTAFIYLQTILPAYNIIIRKNAGDNYAEHYLKHFLKEVSYNILELEKSLDFGDVSKALNLEKQSFNEKIIKFLSKNPVMRKIVSLFKESTPNFSKAIFRDHLSQSISAFENTSNLNTEFCDRLLKVYNFLDYQVPTQIEDLRYDVLRRYTSILSLISTERTPFTQEEVIKKLSAVISSDDLTTSFTNDALYRNEVYCLDLIYVALDLEVKKTANKKIVKKISDKDIPTFLDLVNVALRTEKANDFFDYVKQNCSELKIADEKLMRFHAAANELLFAFDKIEKAENYLKHIVMISDNFEKRNFFNRSFLNFTNRKVLSKISDIVYSSSKI